MQRRCRFGGNDESKKIQKYILKQQFEGFSISNSEGLHKGYDRFQSLLSQLEIHGAGVSTEDANQKFLRALPSSWSQLSLVMRTKPGVDSLIFEDLYNNLRVFKSDVKGSIGLPSSTQNISFVSSKSTNSTNDISTAYVGSTTLGNNLQKEFPSSSSLLTNQSSCLQLDHEDLEQLDEFDLEEMNLKWQVAMISMRLKKFHNKSGRKILFDAKEPVGFDKTKVECYNCHKTWHFARECRSKRNQDSKRKDAWNSGYKAKVNGKRPGNANDKFGLGYGDHKYGSILSYENEVLQSVFMNKESDVENEPLYDRFVSAKGMHAVPPPMTGNYMPSGPDIEIDYSKFTYGPKQSETSESNESDTQTSEYTTCDSDSSNNTPKVVSELMPKLVVTESNVASQTKVWSDAPIIEEYESDSDDDCVSTPSKE
ncbi:ribonuclease H-like domain-containing protein [Tanacetum coccineum]